MHIGYGKIILLGEHFVVHGLPAIVAALDLVTTAEIVQLDSLLGGCWGPALRSHLGAVGERPAIKIIDNRPKVPTYKPLKTKEYEQMVHAVFNILNVTAPSVVTFSGTLPVTNGGIGASAAAAVALARALNHKFNLNLSSDQINQVAFCGEQKVHGTPSGIDNAAATFGGIFAFKKEKERNLLSGNALLKIVIADSGRATNTKQVLAAVNTHKLQNLAKSYTKLFEQAHAALVHNDLVSLGQAMSQNHTLLQELGVSSPELDSLVSCALEHGALGAKLTGTGCGGLMIALAPDAQTQENIAHAFKTAGFFTITQNI